MWGQPALTNAIGHSRSRMRIYLARMYGWIYCVWFKFLKMYSNVVVWAKEETNPGHVPLDSQRSKDFESPETPVY